jgi:hypothetical protein
MPSKPRPVAPSGGAPRSHLAGDLPAPQRAQGGRPPDGAPSRDPTSLSGATGGPQGAAGIPSRGSGTSASRLPSARWNATGWRLMTPTAEGITVVREIVIAAPPEAIWPFLVDPAKAIPGWARRRVSIHELAVTIESRSCPAMHRGLPRTAAADSHARGWDHYLPRLATAASGTDPGVDPWIDGPEI